MNQTSPPATRPVTLAKDVRTLQRRIRAFTSTGTLQTAPTSYHR
ncbi:MAG: hypothetical protein ACRDRW_08645 [Pseudonocardiaceae bacterium]